MLVKDIIKLPSNINTIAILRPKQSYNPKVLFTGYKAQLPDDSDLLEVPVKRIAVGTYGKDPDFDRDSLILWTEEEEFNPLDYPPFKEDE